MDELTELLNVLELTNYPSPYLCLKRECLKKDSKKIQRKIVFAAVRSIKASYEGRMGPPPTNILSMKYL